MLNLWRTVSTIPTARRAGRKSAQSLNRRTEELLPFKPMVTPRHESGNESTAGIEITTERERSCCQTCCQLFDLSGVCFLPTQKTTVLNADKTNLGRIPDKNSHSLFSSLDCY
ncbi:hypothetical protein Y1Q_0011097 [Alligator mississippiensis]|uniref:Uncharacterized protein n=1 Tax=Alligator mississippiensis TaxID=8496 RepID=A0A151MS62_ALLMI|nr:hypothetical protein Y1Q_0011097 [Alligator mississippiensis]